MQTAALQRKPSENQTASTVMPPSANVPETVRETGVSSGVPLFLQRFAAAPPPPVQRTIEEDEDPIRTPVLAKSLSVNAPDDPFEKEADRVADTVMRTPDSGNRQFPETVNVNGAISPTPSGPPSLQRKSCCDEERNEEGSRSSIQRKPSGSAPHPPDIDAEQLFPNGGSPLPEMVRSRIEPVLGTDLGHVSVHTDTRAHDAARSIHARAFTHRNHIFLGRGQSTGDLPLMAHESAHVVQQGFPGTPAIQRDNTPPAGETDTRTGPEEARRRANELYDALNWLNEDQRALDALSGLGEGMRRMVREQFQAARGMSVQDYLKSQLSGDTLVKAFALLSSSSIHEQHTSVALALIPAGTRDADLFRILEGLDVAGRQELEQLYNEAFAAIGEGSLKNDLKDDLSGADEKKALALLDHNLTSAERLYLDSVGITGTNTGDVIRRIQDEWNRGPQAFHQLESDWTTYVMTSRSGEDAWTGMTLTQAMNDELGGEDWEIVRSILNGYQRYKDSVGFETDTCSPDEQNRTEDIQLEVAEEIFRAATTGGYTGAGTNEEQVFNAVRTIRTLWMKRIERAGGTENEDARRTLQQQWEAVRARLGAVIDDEMMEGGAYNTQARLLLEGNLTPADEIYIAKLDFNYDRIIELVTRSWAQGQIDAVLAQTREPAHNGQRPSFDVTFSIPVTRGTVWRRMYSLARDDKNNVQRGVERLHLELSEGDSDSDLRKAYQFLNTTGIDPGLRSDVIRSYVESHLSDREGETDTQKFLSYLANRYERSTTYWDFIDLLSPLESMAPEAAPDEAVRRAEGRMTASGTGIWDSILNDFVRDYDDLTGEDTLAVTAESLERLRFIARNAQASPQELEVMLRISGRSSIAELAGMEYGLFRQRLEEVRQLKRAIAEAIATVVELAVELVLTVITGGGAAGAFIASLTSTIAGMLVREALLGQEYDLVSRENLQQIIIAAASHGFGAIGRGFMDDIISPERLRQLGRVGGFMREATENAIQSVGVQTLTLAFEDQAPSAERLAAGVLSILGGSIGAGIHGDITRRLPVDASDVERFRNRIVANISQNVVSGVMEEGGELIRTGTGDMNALDIASRFSRRTASSVGRGLMGGLGEYGSETVSRDREARRDREAAETLGPEERPLPAGPANAAPPVSEPPVDDPVLLLRNVEQRISDFEQAHPDRATSSDPFYSSLITIRDSLRTETGEPGPRPAAPEPEASPGPEPDEPSARRGEEPRREEPEASTTRTEREGSVRRSRSEEGADLTGTQIVNEALFIAENPHLIEGTYPNRRVQIGNHEWVEHANGTWSRCSKRCRLNLENPLNRSAAVARAEEHLNEARQVAEEMRSRVREVSESMSDLESEAEHYRESAAAHRARADEMDALAALRRAEGRLPEAEEAARQAEEARRDATAAEGDEAAARQLAEEERLRREVEQGRQERTGDEEARVREARDRIREMSGNLDSLDREIADLEHFLLMRPYRATQDDYARLRNLRHTREALITDLRNEITASTGLTDSVRAELRNGTPSAQTRRDTLDSPPPADRGPTGRPRDWVTGEEISSSDASPDHIYPVERIFDEPGFGELPRSDQEAILELPQNLAPMDRGRNSSKGDLSIEQWLNSGRPLAPELSIEQRQAAINRETAAREAVRAEIDRRLNIWRRR